MTLPCRAAITSYTVFGWAVDESDQPIEMGNLTVTELGTALPSGQASRVPTGGVAGGG